MNSSGHDPDRESRRAGDRSSRYVIGADGQPLRDRYGRPVMRRESGSPQRPGSQRPASQRPAPQGGAPQPQSRQEPSAGSFRAVNPSANHQQPEATRFDIGPHAARTTGAVAGASQRRPRQQMPPEGYNADNQAPVQRQFQGAGKVGGSRGRGTWRGTGRGVPPRQGGTRRKRGNPVKRFFGCSGWIVLALVISLVLFVFWTDSRLSRTDALPPSNASSGSGTNWLLVGSDSRQGLSEEDQAELGTGGDVGIGRTDTIMLLHIPRSGTAQLVSIPRDSYVNVPGFGSDKINAAFTYGGPQLLAQTVEEATGVGIDHYAEIGMGGLANVVDSVGGVEICVEEAITDPLAGIDLAAGCQDLKGADALGYVRTRATAQGDLDRVQRQREFFAALLDKITSPATLINPFRAISLINNTSKSFMVNEDDHVWHLARVALAMSSGVDTETVPVGGFMDTNVGNVVLWDEAGAQELFSSMQ